MPAVTLRCLRDPRNGFHGRNRPIEPLLFYLGLALCLATSGRVAGIALGGWRRARRRRSQFLADKQQFVEQVQAAARAGRADRNAFLGWEGIRELKVSAVVDEADGVKSLYLTDPAGKSLPSFEPGQYLTCHFPTAAGEKPLVRCYSLSDRPRDEYYRLTVKLCGSPADSPLAPPGRGSSRIHALAVGDKLPVSAPRGGFFLDPRRDSPLVLIAGGIGVTPMVSILSALVAAGDKREVYLFYGVRNSSEHPLRDQLAQIVANHDNVHQFVAYSRPHDGSQQGQQADQEFVDYQLRGRITEEYIRSVVPTGQFDYYLCGPGEMMQMLVEALLARGVGEDRILYEAFGPASIRRPAGAKGGKIDSPSPGVDAATVRFATSESEAAWTNECESLLDLIEASGVRIDSGCRAGNCGMCVARVLEGQVTTVKEPGAATPEGHCLACISVPTSPIVLDL